MSNVLQRGKQEVPSLGKRGKGDQTKERQGAHEGKRPVMTKRKSRLPWVLQSTERKLAKVKKSKTAKSQLPPSKEFIDSEEEDELDE